MSFLDRVEKHSAFKYFFYFPYRGFRNIESFTSQPYLSSSLNELFCLRHCSFELIFLHHQQNIIGHHLKRNVENAEYIPRVVWTINRN